MARFQVLVSDEAAKNIASIFDWIAARSPEGADRWYRVLHQGLAKLGDHADQFPVAPDCRKFTETIRNIFIHMKSGRRYRVLFTIVGTDVHVLFVRGPGQDWLAP